MGKCVLIGKMCMFLFILSSILCCLLYYVQSFKTGLTAKKWALAGLLFGPTIYPLFRSQQRIQLMKARGVGSALFQV